MAGHSKWAKVKHFKGAIDAKRAKTFAKLARELTVAARAGGGDPGMNPRLRMVLLKCRSANMPADNVERAIKRGTGGEDNIHYEDLTYEVFGPQGVACLVELSTDNRNRTAAEVRSLLNKHGGNIATSGSVSRLFQRKGQVFVARDTVPEEVLMELAVESGAEDFKAEGEGYEILTEPANFEPLLRQLEARAIRYEVASVTFLPVQTVLVEAAQAATVRRLIDVLEEHDDVKEVYTNAELPDDPEGGQIDPG